jgi:NAD(P)-dependent dehydrogenase (short-subunit alcohol dehydrogenase family)
MSKIDGKVAFVTGANRGIGRAFVEELLAAGASKVYASARKVETLDDLVENSNGRVIAVDLDVTSPDAIESVVAKHKDVSILINNAGIAAFEGVISAKDDSGVRAEMETNFFGVFNMTRSFSPILAANGGGVVVNMSSIAGHVNFPVLGTYSATKAAVHSLTQSVRAELAAQGTLVVGVYPGPVDTDMAASFPMDKVAPNGVVQAILKAVEDGIEDVYPDPVSAELHTGLLSNPKAVEKQTGEMLPS